jgi:hypothetical protein
MILRTYKVHMKMSKTLSFTHRCQFMNLMFSVLYRLNKWGSGYLFDLTVNITTKLVIGNDITYYKVVK